MTHHVPVKKEAEDSMRMATPPIDPVRNHEGRRPRGRLRRLTPQLAAALSLVLAGSAMAVDDLDVDPRLRPLPERGSAEVMVSVFLLDLFEIDSARQTFSADVVILAQWQDPRLAGRWTASRSLDVDEVWQPRLQVVNQRSVERTMDREVEVQPDGTVIFRRRLSGDFSAKLDLQEFPLDRQRFEVVVVAAGYTPDEVDLVPDTNRSGRSDHLSISDWRIDPPRVVATGFEVPGTGRTLPAVRFEFEGARQLRYYVVQLMLPLVAIVLMAWSVFWVDPTVIPTRMSVVVTTMLTLIAYRFAIGSMVPRLAYLTRLDWFLLGSTMLVLIALLAVSAGAYLVAHDRMATVHRLDRLSRAAFPIAIVALLAATWLF
jgi:hypothetical protein